MAGMYNPHLGDANEFLSEHTRLVHHIVNKYPYPRYREDLVGAGMYGLTKAYGTFNPNSGANWSTYAATCITNEILQVLRKVKRWSKEGFLDDPLAEDETGHQITLADVLVGGTLDETSTDVQTFMSSVSERERALIEMRFSGLKQREIADRIGISQAMVSRVFTGLANRYRKGKWSNRRTFIHIHEEEFVMRKDVWTLEDDETLTRTVMDFIRRGQTQLAAFEEAAQILGRTAQSCGFRWNGKLRHAHNDEITEIRPARKYTRKSDGSQYMGIAFDPKLHKKVKVYSIIKEIPMGDIVNAAISEYMDKHWNEALAESI